MWQFSEAIDGIAEACRALDVPITGGNVSFYNETLGKAIYPTPILGVLGLIEDASCALGSGFQSEGDAIVLLDGSEGGASCRAAESVEEMSARSFSSSEYAKTIHGAVGGRPPLAIDLEAEKRLIECLVQLASEKAIRSAHDVSDGGVAVTIAESCFGSDGLSADVVLESAGSGGSKEEPAEFALFGERGARAVVSISPASLARVREIAAQWKVKAMRIGTVTRGQSAHPICDGPPESGAAVIEGALGALREIWSRSLAKALESE